MIIDNIHKKKKIENGGFIYETKNSIVGISIL